MRHTQLLSVTHVNNNADKWRLFPSQANIHFCDAFYFQKMNAQGGMLLLLACFFLYDFKHNVCTKSLLTRIFPALDE